MRDSDRPISPRSYFGPELFAFLRELRANNSRGWFEENKERYELHVREPFLDFIADFGPILHRLSWRFLADPRPVGGSLLRLHRDTRFSKDKSPYKPMATAFFKHEAAKDVHAPGFWLQLEPDGGLAAAGVWRPDATTLARVRDAIVAHSEQWRLATSSKSFTMACDLWGEKLKRAPVGYDRWHPLLEDLKRTDFIAARRFTEQTACAPDFLEWVAETYRAAGPFMSFVTAALELAW